MLCKFPCTAALCVYTCTHASKISYLTEECILDIRQMHMSYIWQYVSDRDIFHIYLTVNDIPHFSQSTDMFNALLSCVINFCFSCKSSNTKPEVNIVKIHVCKHSYRTKIIHVLHFFGMGYFTLYNCKCSWYIMIVVKDDGILFHTWWRNGPNLHQRRQLWVHRMVPGMLMYRHCKTRAVCNTGENNIQQCNTEQCITEQYSTTCNVYFTGKRITCQRTKQCPSEPSKDFLPPQRQTKDSNNLQQ